jgi:hypothetical protein
MPLLPAKHNLGVSVFITSTECAIGDADDSAAPQKVSIQNGGNIVLLLEKN